MKLLMKCIMCQHAFTPASSGVAERSSDFLVIKNFHKGCRVNQNVAVRAGILDHRHLLWSWCQTDNTEVDRPSVHLVKNRLAFLLADAFGLEIIKQCNCAKVRE